MVTKKASARVFSMRKISTTSRVLVGVLSVIALYHTFSFSLDGDFKASLMKVIISVLSLDK